MIRGYEGLYYIYPHTQVGVSWRVLQSIYYFIQERKNQPSIYFYRR